MKRRRVVKGSTNQIAFAFYREAVEASKKAEKVIVEPPTEAPEPQCVEIGTLRLNHANTRTYNKLTPMQQKYVTADLLHRLRIAERMRVALEIERTVIELLDIARFLNDIEAQQEIRALTRKAVADPIHWNSPLAAVQGRAA